MGFPFLLWKKTHLRHTAGPFLVCLMPFPRPDDSYSHVEIVLELFLIRFHVTAEQANNRKVWKDGASISDNMVACQILGTQAI